VRNYNFGSDSDLNLAPDLPTYRALSYRWDEETVFGPVSVPVNDAYCLGDGPNLFRFLMELTQDMHFESGVRGYFLWVEQICINEKDDNCDEP
jgi:hypothetical protein